MYADADDARPQEDPAAGRPASAGPPAGGSLPEPPPPAREFEEVYDTGVISRLPTGELLVVHRDWDPSPADEHASEEEVVERSLYGTVASASGIIGVLAALFVGWAVPLSIAAIVFGVLGIRRGTGDGARSAIGIATGAAGTLFSMIWIFTYVTAAGVLG
ncbi:hypothetical protein ARHIZOSPH14_22440 [Agromyces rhizosphaerae]|uniref:DUF4190 domain-containing protein n=1 Tax=Agromyces rhizosphaerae TaxID=88374 RepID=A0A9W6CWR8_9MICO|nr:DUF4190 domain-containing protein [Agromyces rhizosphaerae]GLI28002.1 hypothetical protein ARHIZOSPH14_22440 [Agromyces rhizosphaerae]